MHTENLTAIAFKESSFLVGLHIKYGLDLADRLFLFFGRLIIATIMIIKQNPAELYRHLRYDPNI